MLAVKDYQTGINIYLRTANKPASTTDATRSAGTDQAAAKQPSNGTATKQLSQTEAKNVEKLEQTNQTVKAHEAAHLAAAGGLAKGGASFSYTKGPDGKLYATGGEVSIDTSAEKTPAATIQKMNRVRAAALAPADPSGQDRQVAAQAAAKAAQAAQDLSIYNSQGQKAGAPAEAAGRIVDVLA